MRALAFAALSLLGLSLAACGPGAVGEACNNPGDGSDCVDGAICTPDLGTEPTEGFDPTWASYTCRVDCTTGVRCEAGFECRPVTGREMISSCQVIPTE